MLVVTRVPTFKCTLHTICAYHSHTQTVTGANTNIRLYANTIYIYKQFQSHIMHKIHLKVHAKKHVPHT
jgi:hypothetical protein